MDDSLPRTFAKNRILILSVVLAVLLSAVGVKLHQRFQNSVPLNAHAERVFRAIEDKNSGTLIGYTLDDEAKKGGLTGESLAKLLNWTESIWSTLPGEFSELSFGDRVGDVTLECIKTKNVQGAIQPPALSFTLTRSDDKPVFPVAYTLFCCALYARYAPHQAEISSFEKTWVAFSVGLKEQREFLDSIGIKGIVNSKLDFISLDDLQKRADRVVERTRLQKLGAPSSSR